MRILNIAWKDFRHTYRDVAALAMMFLIPFVLAFVLGTAFGSSSQFVIPPVQTIVVDEDRGTLGGFAVEALTSPGLAEILTVQQVDSRTAAMEAVDRGEAGVAVILPAGLTQAVTAQEDIESIIVIYSDPTLTIGPTIVSSVLRSLAQSFEGARAAAGSTARLVASSEPSDPSVAGAAAAAAAEQFSKMMQQDPPLLLEATSPRLPGAQDRFESNIGAEVLLGMMVFFTLFGASVPAGSILEEHRAGTLSRMFTTPARRTTILAGKYVAVFCVVLVQTAIILVGGRFLLDARWGELGPVFALAVCGALVATSLALLVVSAVKTEAQAGGISSAVFVFFAMMGGSFFGSLSENAVIPTQRFVPNGWLLEGWARIIHGGSWGDILPHLLIALAFAVVFFGLASFFFRRRYA